MSKKYFIRGAGWGNMYDLAWADNTNDIEKLESKGFTRCSRKWAEQQAHREIDRRKYDPAFSGYASRAVYPAPYYFMDEWDRETFLIGNYELKGVIWE